MMDKYLTERATKKITTIIVTKALQLTLINILNIKVTHVRFSLQRRTLHIIKKLHATTIKQMHYPVQNLPKKMVLIWC